MKVTVFSIKVSLFKVKIGVNFNKRDELRSKIDEEKNF